VAGGSKLASVLMFRHMTLFYKAPAQVRRPASPLSDLYFSWGGWPQRSTRGQTVRPGS